MPVNAVHFAHSVCDEFLRYQRSLDRRSNLPCLGWGFQIATCRASQQGRRAKMVD
jgi:hypothetical protein